MGVVSLAALTVLDAGPIGQVRAACAAGFEFVGLRLQPLVETDEVVIGDADKEREIAELLASSGMRVLEVGVFPLRPTTDVEAWGPTLAFCHRIGASYVVSPIEDPDRKRRVETLRAFSEMAETCALDVLVEFNPYSACPTLEDAVELVQDCGHPNAKVLVDALHLSRSGGKPSDVLQLDPGLVPLVHFCDAPPPPQGPLSADELRRESRTARLLPGEGSLWLDELLDALSPQVAISVEAPSARHAHLSATERAKLSLQTTKSLLARRGR